MSTSTPPRTADNKKPQNRRRSSSITNALNQVPLNERSTPSKLQKTSTDTGIRDNKPRKPRRDPNDAAARYDSLGFWQDLKTGRWMLVPETSFKLLLVPVLYHFNHTLLVHANILSPDSPNPVRPLLFLSGQAADGRYGKHWNDVLFIAHQIIWWSFVRQFMTLKVLRPLAKSFGIKGGKIERFTEQGYAIFYMGLTSISGITIMRGLPMWWYKTEHFWLEYPHTLIPWGMKLFYLLQFSYWLQQTIILAAKIEKPRKDFKELVAHHIVTLYLIFWSYMTYFTHIGLAIFVTMDVSDVFLALAKCTNYVDEKASQPVFAFFVLVWTYFRHYLNIKILWSVWNEFFLIPYERRQLFDPLNDKWAAPWLRKMIFAPIFLLQLINLFWYFLILRILYRAVFAEPLKDERSDEEDEAEEEEVEEVKVIKGPKAE
ncbi:TLC domain-containing protein [Dioszegia hungarica]|uniref:TLC domain-containing protein n=1 Tax=Dioszegia hungarica TaxID=4972 RepID=A0AA38HAI8_9TREE|nr:TLC domain-containing protein [Dioszegia hungarica]KAI9637300.1 TLC domain-containing protein [Dioszegia hungarica]